MYIIENNDILCLTILLKYVVKVCTTLLLIYFLNGKSRFSKSKRDHFSGNINRQMKSLVTTFHLNSVKSQYFFSGRQS